MGKNMGPEDEDSASQPQRRSDRKRRKSTKFEESNEMPSSLEDVTPDLGNTKSAKRAAVPPTGGARKKSRDSVLGDVDPRVARTRHLGPQTPGTAAHDASLPIRDRYNLPSFESLLVGKAAMFFDDGADDNWEDFDGNVENWHNMTSSDTPSIALANAVAGTFVSRAQKAHQAEQSWKTFEENEQNIDSGAVTEKDTQKRKLLLKDALDNGLRMAIFEKIAPRICVEIFHTAWNGNSVKAATGKDVPIFIKQEYGDDPDRTTKSWRSGGALDSVPVFNDDASDASSGPVDLEVADTGNGTNGTYVP